MTEFLVLRLEAPLMSFGTVAVDGQRPVQAWPPVSMLTGLLGNALGWDRFADAARLERLQSRLVWAAVIDREGDALEDYQTAQLGAHDVAWTTRGSPEERAGGEASYDSPVLRSRHYRADACVLVALGLADPDEHPTLARLADALARPARPLFLGRKGCLPATRVLQSVAEGDDAMDALRRAAPPGADDRWLDARRVFHGEGVVDAGVILGAGTRVRRHAASDERRFAIDVHGGRQSVYEWLPVAPTAEVAR